MNKSRLLNFFPLPDYLKMPAVGIDISDRSLKYIELSEKRGILSISHYGTKMIPKGIIEEGQIKERQKLVEFLKSIKKEIKTRFVNFSLPEEKAFISRIEMPAIKEEEIKSAIEFQMEEHIPLSANDAIFDFEFVDSEKINKNSLHVNLAAYPKVIVEDYRDIILEAGFTPLVFEVETQAFARVMAPKDDNDSYFLIDFGKTRTTFTIISGKKVQFTSTVRIGGDDLNSAIVKNLNVDEFKAEDIKKERGFIKSKNNEKVFNALLSIVAAVKDEIKRHVEYWNSHLEEKEREAKKIKKILLCGGDSNLTGLTDYLSYELRIPAEISNPCANIFSFDKNIPEIEFRESLIYAVALGLALRSFLHS